MRGLQCVSGKEVRQRPPEIALLIGGESGAICFARHDAFRLPPNQQLLLCPLVLSLLLSFTDCEKSARSSFVPTHTHTSIDRDPAVFTHTQARNRPPLAMQEPLSSPAQACLYIARWAIPKGGATAAELHHLRREADIGVDAKMVPAQAVIPSLECHRLILLPTAVQSRSPMDVTSIAVTGRNGRSIFVKQARGFLKWVPSMALERERMEREVAYFEEIATVLEGDAKRFLPTIHDFDRESSVIIMDYLEDHRVLFEHLFEHGSIPYNAACGLADFTAIVAARTLAPRKPSNAAAAALAAGRAEKYWNPTLRAIQQEHVYSICFRESEIGRELASDDELMDEVRCLKAKYLGYSFDEFDRWSVCHGTCIPAVSCSASAASKSSIPSSRASALLA